MKNLPSDKKEKFVVTGRETNTMTVNYEKEAQEAAERFMAKLTNKQFVISRSQNTEDDYDAVKQERDSQAVAKFVETKTFQDIMDLK